MCVVQPNLTDELFDSYNMELNRSNAYALGIKDKSFRHELMAANI